MGNDTLILTGQLRIVRRAWSDQHTMPHHEDTLQQGWRGPSGEIVWKPVPIVLEKDVLDIESTPR